MKKNKNIESPIDLMFVIVNRHQGHKVCEILNDYHLATHINCIGYGTAESGIADLFGFGIIERDIVLSLVKSELSGKILEDLNKDFHFDERHNGLAFTVPINSIEKKLLNLIKIDIGD